MNTQTLAVALVLSAFTLRSDARERLTIRVAPVAAFAPADLVVRTTIEADTENRAIEVVAESSEFYRSSLMPLDGDKAPRTTLLEFRSLPPGAYRVSATLFGPSGEVRASAAREISL
jgi:hypothetical protein